MGQWSDVVVRRLLLVTGWAAAALIAGVVAWSAVARLGYEGGTADQTLLTQSEIRRELAQQPSTAGATGTAAGPQSPQSPQSPQTQRGGAGTSPPSDTRTPPAGGSSPAPTGGSSPPRGRSAPTLTAPPSGQATSSKLAQPPAPPRRSRSWPLEGGEVGASCRGQVIQLIYASPHDGWTMQVVQSGSNRVEVRFSRGGSTSTLVAVCSDGYPSAETSGGGGTHDGGGGDTGGDGGD